MIKLIKKVFGINEKNKITEKEKIYFEKLLKNYIDELSIIENRPESFSKEEKDKMIGLVKKYKTKLGQLK